MIKRYSNLRKHKNSIRELLHSKRCIVVRMITSKRYTFFMSILERV